MIRYEHVKERRNIKWITEKADGRGHGEDRADRHGEDIARNGANLDGMISYNQPQGSSSSLISYNSSIRKQQ